MGCSVPSYGLTHCAALPTLPHRNLFAQPCWHWRAWGDSQGHLEGKMVVTAKMGTVMLSYIPGDRAGLLLGAAEKQKLREGCEWRRGWA